MTFFLVAEPVAHTRCSCCVRLYSSPPLIVSTHLLHRRRGYFDVALALDLVAALYEVYLPVARTPHSAASHYTPNASPLLATPPLATSDSSTQGSDLSAAQARKHMLSHLAERAFGIVLACMRQRELAMHETGANGAAGGQMPQGERDSLRAFLQRAAGSVVCFPVFLLPFTVDQCILIAPHEFVHQWERICPLSASCPCMATATVPSSTCS